MRYNNYQEIYFNSTVVAVQLMFRDVLLEADSYFDFESYLNDPEKYMTLDDRIFKFIEKSKKPSLKNAQNILRRITVRELYGFVGMDESTRSINISEEDIVACSEGQLMKEEVIVFKYSISYGCKDKNPLFSQYFYQRQDNRIIRLKTPEDCINLGLSVPSVFLKYFV